MNFSRKWFNRPEFRAFFSNLEPHFQNIGLKSLTNLPWFLIKSQVLSTYIYLTIRVEIITLDIDQELTHYNQEFRTFIARAE